MPLIMSENARADLEEMQKYSRFPTGVGRIDRGECPRDATTAVTCMFCLSGHLLECHYPRSCEEAECSHRGPAEE